MRPTQPAKLETRVKHNTHNIGKLNLRRKGSHKHHNTYVNIVLLTIMHIIYTLVMNIHKYLTAISLDRTESLKDEQQIQSYSGNLRGRFHLTNTQNTTTTQMHTIKSDDKGMLGTFMINLMSVSNCSFCISGVLFCSYIRLVT